MTSTVTKQSLASTVRQVLGVVSTVFGIITASVSALHLPPWVSAILTAFGPVILTVEHYVGDPSTGTTAVVPGEVVNKALDIAHQAVSHSAS